MGARASARERTRAHASTVERPVAHCAHVLPPQRVAEALKLETSGAVSREGSVEYDPLYQLVVDSNQLMVEIREEIAALHKYVAGVYATKFPELEGLVPNPLEYVKVVQRIGNEMVRFTAPRRCAPRAAAANCAAARARRT